jgi:16S rRNA (uracil1498-N3)-methyltransferase
MNLPFFYISHFSESQQIVALDEDTSRHVVQVLRMKNGGQLNLTDGMGNLLTGEITNADKKRCTVNIKSRIKTQKPERSVTVAISLLKNTNRFEWFLEKATEIGVSDIIPLICERTEKEKFRMDRLQGICISAMLQSQQTWLPHLHGPQQFENLKTWKCGNGTNLIAHCIEDNKQVLSTSYILTSPHSLICIGPEGDFTPGEIELALQHDFIPVSLGKTRLRTETAGVVAAALLCNR